MSTTPDPRGPAPDPSAATVELSSAGVAPAASPSAGRETAALRKSAPASSSRPSGAVSSNLRKAAVRAALFQKVESVRIGRFFLLEQLGAGAMGEIYAAYDEQLDRKVALKLVKSGGRAGNKADERLLREAQTLAQVSHPNVVPIYEAGTYNGRLFIAMELIRGKTLTSWLKDAEQVPWAVRQREILRQFIAAGRGLEAAHAAGLAHRDFKPDNVLVGDDGRVRVVDFGLARALGDEPDIETAPDGAGASGASAAPRGTPPAAEIERLETLSVDGPIDTDGATLHHQPAAAGPAPRAAAGDPLAKPDRSGSGSGTGSGADRSTVPKLKAALRLTETGTVMGTLRFMAPEQMRGEVADQRSDQFSFCVALYHALYKAYPFAGDSWQELRAAMDSGEAAPGPAIPVAASVRGVLRRGLSVQPSQRFPSMGELLAALEPQGRRRRAWIAATAGVLAIGLGGAVYVGSRAPEDPCASAGAAIDAPWSAERQAAVQAAFGRDALPFAEPAWRGVKTRVDDYAGRWRGEAAAACRATHVEHTQSAAQLDKRMLCLDRGRRGLAALVGELAAGAPGAVEHAIEAAEALPALDACGDARNLLFGLEPPPAPIANKVAAIRDQIAHAFTLEVLGRREASLAEAREATAAAAAVGYPPVRAEALVQTARALGQRGTPDAAAEAERLYLEALDIAEAVRHDELAARIWSRLVLQAVVHAGADRAYQWWRRNEAAVRRLGDNAYEQAMLHDMRGAIYFREGKYAKAAEEQRLAIADIGRAPAHQIELSRYNNSLAKSLEYLNEPGEALKLHERAVAIAKEGYGAGHPTVVKLQATYGWALKNRGQIARARGVLDEALASMAARDREAHPDAALIHGYLSVLDYQEGRFDRAAEHGRASLAIYRAAKSSDTAIAEAYMHLSDVEVRRANFAGALALAEEALAIRRRGMADHFLTGAAEVAVAESMFELGRHDDALPHLAEAERIFEKVFERSPGLRRDIQPWMLTVRGEILVGQRQHAAALPVLQRAIEMFDRDKPADATNHALALGAMARALHGLGRDAARVRALAEQSHAMLEAQGAKSAYYRDAIVKFLQRLPARPAPRTR